MAQYALLKMTQYNIKESAYLVKIIKGIDIPPPASNQTLISFLKTYVPFFKSVNFMQERQLSTKIFHKYHLITCFSTLLSKSLQMHCSDSMQPDLIFHIILSTPGFDTPYEIQDSEPIPTNFSQPPYCPNNSANSYSTIHFQLLLFRRYTHSSIPFW